MTFRSLATALLGLALVTTACSKKKVPVVQPQTPPGGTSQPPAQVPAANQNRPPVGTAAPATRTDETAALLVSIADRIHFDFDQAAIMSADAARLDRKAAIMRANPNLKIRIIGHCDERGSDSYNIALGMKRASAAKDYLVRAGIDASRIEIASLGREALIDNAGTEEAMAKNRRDEFEVTAGGTNLVGGH